MEIYGKLPGNDRETRYSPAQRIGMKMDVVLQLREGSCDLENHTSEEERLHIPIPFKFSLNHNSVCHRFLMNSDYQRV